MCTPDGFLFSREAILENLLAQKKANKRKLAAWKAQQAERQRKVWGDREGLAPWTRERLGLDFDARRVRYGLGRKHASDTTLCLRRTQPSIFYSHLDPRLQLSPARPTHLA